MQDSQHVEVQNFMFNLLKLQEDRELNPVDL